VPTTALPNAAESDTLQAPSREQAYRDGFEAGRSDGLAAGRNVAEAEARTLALQLAGAIKRFDDGVANLEKEVAQELLNLALGIARRIVGETLEAKPEVVLASIREALAQLPAQHAVIHLSSEDAELIRTQTGDTLGRAGHRILENPQLTRGDVLVEAGGTHVDARLATRWQRVWDALEQEPVASRNES
jgi:flagellar assembly protein FliH